MAIDTIDASSLTADGMQLTINGGLGDDTMIGSDGADRSTAATATTPDCLGDGDDTFVWNPGDDNDVVEGQNGFDTLAFNGANIAENIDISANGGRVRLFRDIANVTMDFDDVEIDRPQGARRRRQHHRQRPDRHRRRVRRQPTCSPAVASATARADNVIVNATNGDDVVRGHRQRQRCRA